MQFGLGPVLYRIHFHWNASPWRLFLGLFGVTFESTAPEVNLTLIKPLTLPCTAIYISSIHFLYSSSSQTLGGLGRVTCVCHSESRLLSRSPALLCCREPHISHLLHTHTPVQAAPSSSHPLRLLHVFPCFCCAPSALSITFSSPDHQVSSTSTPNQSWRHKYDGTMEARRRHQHPPLHAHHPRHGLHWQRTRASDTHVLHGRQHLLWECSYRMPEQHVSPVSPYFRLFTS